MENAWNMHRTSMEYVWNMHVIRVEYVRMEHAWNMEGLCMGYVWNMYGISWNMNEISHYMHGTCGGDVWNTRGISVDAPVPKRCFRTPPKEVTPDPSKRDGVGLSRHSFRGGFEPPQKRLTEYCIPSVRKFPLSQNPSESKGCVLCDMLQ